MTVAGLVLFCEGAPISSKMFTMYVCVVGAAPTAGCCTRSATVEFLAVCPRRISYAAIVVAASLNAS